MPFSLDNAATVKFANGVSTGYAEYGKHVLPISPS